MSQPLRGGFGGFGASGAARPKFVYQPTQPAVSDGTRNDHTSQRRSRDTPSKNSTPSTATVPQSSTNTTVANVHKADLNKLGYKDLEDWLRDPNHVYIGRDMTRYIPGAAGSKWGNPFKSRDPSQSVDNCRRYRDHVLSSKFLVDSLSELKGKTLGCWCHPNTCHGHELVKLVEECCGD